MKHRGRNGRQGDYRIVSQGTVHEAFPRGQRNRRTEDVTVERAVDTDELHRHVLIGVTDPHHRGDLRRVSSKPRVGVVLRGSGLATSGAATSEVEALAGAYCHHLLQTVGDTVGNLGGDHLGTRHGRRRHDGAVLELHVVALEVLDVQDGTRLAVNATVGKGLVHRCHGEWRRVLRTERHGGHQFKGLAVRTVEAHGLRSVADIAQVKLAGHGHIGGVHRVSSGEPHGLLHGGKTFGVARLPLTHVTAAAFTVGAPVLEFPLTDGTGNHLVERVAGAQPFSENHGLE